MNDFYYIGQMLGKEQGKDLIPFKPHPLIRGGDLQTIIGYYLPGPTQLKARKVHEVPLPDGDRLALCENRPSRKSTFQPAVVFMHGLGGDARSPYILRLAMLFRDRGWNTLRMNHRGCGEGNGLARNLYHSGRSEDISQALLKIEELYPETPVIAVGFSLSGNALLKLLGERKDPVASNLRGAIAVAPPIELSCCAEELCRLKNRVYDRRFVRLLRQAIRERQRAFPDFPRFKFPWNMTVWGFDEICTAPMNGFESAEDYYVKCSAKQFLSRITIPTVMLASEDDPFIPRLTYESLPQNDNVYAYLSRSGGHMGFVSAQKTPLENRRWMDYAVLTWAERLVGTGTMNKSE